MNFKFFMPVEVIVEKDCIEKNRTRFRDFGEKCIIITDSIVGKISGALDDVINALNHEGIQWILWDKVLPNPPAEMCWNAGKLAREEKADFIVGIGGGSSMDAAKAASVFARNMELEAEDIFKKEKKHTLPLVLIGTTSGTGSEVTSFSILTDRMGKKRNCGGSHIYANLVLGDPKYTFSVPQNVTISTALDAVTHVLEGYFNKESNEFSDFIAIEAMKLLVPCISSLQDIDAEVSREVRELLYVGALYAGIVLNTAGTIFGHKMGYYLSEEYHIPHGFACAVFSPELIKIAEKSMPDKLSKLCKEAKITSNDLICLIKNLTDVPELNINRDTIISLVNEWGENVAFTKTPGNFDFETRVYTMCKAIAEATSFKLEL